MSPEVLNANSNRGPTPVGPFLLAHMKKRQKVLPKAPTEWERLQTEREQLQAILDKPERYYGSITRTTAAVRLVEVKRALNRLWANKR